MIRLGQTVETTKTNATQMWLCKRPSLKQYTDKIYVVLGFYPGKGWATLSNGTLAEMRRYIEKCM